MSTGSSRGGLGGKATKMFKHSCHFLLLVVQIPLGVVHMVKILTKKESCACYRHPWKCDIYEMI